MGNVRSEKVKKISRELHKRHPEMFSTNFEENKNVVPTLVNIVSKRLKNTIAGYVTHLVVLSEIKAISETD